jgi:F-type H+-transporting ATPase subunit b
MLIDWFTVGAQVVNFLILVWLLKHFLYGPIIDAIDARENRIAKELADADERKAQAQEEHETYRKKNEAFDKQRATLISEAQDEASTERSRLMDEAHQAADALSAKRQKALQQDTDNLHQAIGRRAQQEVFAITRKALTDLAGTCLEERMCDVFIHRLQEMDDKTKAEFATGLKSALGLALLRSAFDLPPAQRTAIQNAVNSSFSAETKIEFETAPDLVSGIELTSNGQKVAWSIAEYLLSLQKGVDELLLEGRKSETKTKTKTKTETGTGTETETETETDAKSKAKAEQGAVEDGSVKKEAVKEGTVNHGE